MTMTSFSARLTEAMTARGSTVSKLAVETGINKGTISAYKSGKYEPKQDNLYRIADALDVSEPWLMGYDVSMTRRRSAARVKGQTVKGRMVTTRESQRMRAFYDAFERADESTKKAIRLLLNLD